MKSIHVKDLKNVTIMFMNVQCNKKITDVHKHIYHYCKRLMNMLFFWHLCSVSKNNVRNYFVEIGCQLIIFVTLLVLCKKTPLWWCLYAYGHIVLMGTNIYIGTILQFNYYGSILFVHLWIEDCWMFQFNNFCQISYVHRRISLIINSHTRYILCLNKIII